MCLGQEDERRPARSAHARPIPSDNDAPLIAAIRAAIALGGRKPRGHDFDYSAPDRRRTGLAPHEPHRRELKASPANSPEHLSIRLDLGYATLFAGRLKGARDIIAPLPDRCARVTKPEAPITIRARQMEASLLT
jgi:hypothetical protein